MLDSFAAYQMRARGTAKYPRNLPGIGMLYCALGLAEESGEVAGKLKKWIRDDGTDFENEHMSNERRELIFKEMGDALWYLTNLAIEMDSSLAQIAQWNLDKVEDRRARGVTHGSGDNR